MPDFAKFRAAARARAALKRERLGQAYFNTLFFDGFDPQLADEIRGTEHDPFYLDGLVPALEALIQERWRD